jgi:hypothetical protein
MNVVAMAKMEKCGSHGEGGESGGCSEDFE